MQTLMSVTRGGAFAAATVVLAAICAGCGPRGDLDLVLSCDRTGGLEPGSPVLINGVQVGEVVRTDLAADGRVAVDVIVRERYRRNVTRDARITIAGSDEDAFVEIRPGTDRPAVDGAVFEVRTGWIERLKATSREFYGRITSEETRRKLERFGDRVEEALEEGRAELEKEWPEIERQARELLELLESEGSEAAETIEREIRELLETHGDEGGPRSPRT